MGLIGVFFALVYAILMTWLFAIAFRNTGPWNGFWVFFVIIFLIALSVGEWSPAIGPRLWGYYWVPGLVASVILALLIASTASGQGNSRFGRKPFVQKKQEEEAESAEGTMIILGIFFWVVIFILIILGVWGLIRRTFYFDEAATV